jgi:hypothetical protein
MTTPVKPRRRRPGTDGSARTLPWRGVAEIGAMAPCVGADGIVKVKPANCRC